MEGNAFRVGRDILHEFLALCVGAAVGPHEACVGGPLGGRWGAAGGPAVAYHTFLLDWDWRAFGLSFGDEAVTRYLSQRP